MGIVTTKGNDTLLIKDIYGNMLLEINTNETIKLVRCS